MEEDIMGENNENGDFLSLGAGAVAALILLALVLKLTGIQVEGWIRYAVIPVYVVLLVFCAWAVDPISKKSGVINVV